MTTPAFMATLSPEVRAMFEAQQASNIAQQQEIARLMRAMGSNAPAAARPAIEGPPKKKARSGKDDFESEDDSAPPSDADTESDSEWNDVRDPQHSTPNPQSSTHRAHSFCQQAPSHLALR